MKRQNDILKDFFLFLSAFVPMFVLIFVKLVIDMMNHNLSFNVLNTLNFVTLILLIVLGICGLIWNIYSKEGTREITIISLSNITDQHFLGYFSLFVLFALQLDLSLVSGYCTFVLIMIFIGIVYIKNALFYINPLLNILGYNFYDITYTIEGDSEKRQNKMFFKGTLKEGMPYYVNIKNDNFTFIDKQVHKKRKKQNKKKP